MDRRDFLIKLGKSLLLIATVAASGFVLADRNAVTGDDCPSGTTCEGCGRADQCGLPQKNTVTNSKGANND